MAAARIFNGELIPDRPTEILMMSDDLVILGIIYSYFALRKVPLGLNPKW